MPVLRTLATLHAAEVAWRECQRLGHSPHSIFWHEAEKMWAFWVL
jgi:hypothetical protein